MTIFKRTDSIDPRGLSRFGQESAQGKIPFRKITPDHIQNQQIIITKIWTFDPDTGTTPFNVTASMTTVVSNLNADMLDGNHASAFATTGGSLTTPSIPYATGVSALADSNLSQQSGYVRNTGYFQTEGLSATYNAFLYAAEASTVDQYIDIAGHTGFIGWKASDGIDIYNANGTFDKISIRNDTGSLVLDEGVFTLTGNLVPEATGTRDLGTSSVLFGNLFVERINYAYLDKGAASGTFEIDFSAGSVQYVNLTNSSSAAVTFANVSTGDILLLQIRRGSNSGALTWPAGVDWGDNGAPTAPTTAGKSISVLFISHNGSTEIQGVMVDAGAEWTLADI